jgi:hypothetical protein
LLNSRTVSLAVSRRFEEAVEALVMAITPSKETPAKECQIARIIGPSLEKFHHKIKGRKLR